MDLTETDTRRAAEQLFGDVPAAEETEYVTTVAQLPGVNQEVAKALAAADIEDIETFLAAVENESVYSVAGVTREDIDVINKIISENVEFTEEEVEEPEEEEVEYFCPECGERITLDMTHCPKCNTELVFEEE